MDFDLSEDQRALQDGARAFLDARCGPEVVRAHLSTGRPYDAALWSAMADQGWCALAVPEDQGGLGLSWVEAAVLVGEVGRHVTPVPIVPALVAIAAVVGVPEHAGLLARMVEGASIGSVAWTPRDDAVSATGDPERPLLSGRVGPVEGASVADVAVVLTPTSAFLVDLEATGRPRPEPAMDLTRTLSWLDLDETPATRLGGAEESARLASLGAVAACAEMLGGAERVLEMATQYAKDRIQFGVPIGSFQAVKHRCADMLVDVEGMRSVTWYGAWTLSAQAPGWATAASTAKIWCADASRRVMASGLQVHGGIGFTWEHDLHLYIKRAQFSQLDYGDAAHHRDRVATDLRAAVLDGVGVL